jgi:hypothetical protein
MTVQRRPLAGQAAIALAIFGAVLAAAGVLLAVSNRGVVLPSAFELGPGASFFLGTVPFVLAGGLLAGKRPGNHVGWILLAVGLVWQVHGVAGEYRVMAWSAGSPAPWAAWSWDLLWLPGVALVPVLFATFPDGRLPSPRWRPVPVLLGVAVGLYVAGVGLRPGTLSNTPIDNPLGVPALGGVTPLLEALGQITFVGAALLSFAAPVVRYRQAGRVQRYQLKWFVAAAALVVTSWIFADVLQAVGLNGPFIAPIRTLPLVALPVATAVAVLRYRLYDIDVALNRGLLYAGLAAVLGAIYLAVVVGIGTLVGGQGGALRGVVAGRARAPPGEPLARCRSAGRPDPRPAAGHAARVPRCGPDLRRSPRRSPAGRDRGDGGARRTDHRRRRSAAARPRRCRLARARQRAVGLRAPQLTSTPDHGSGHPTTPYGTQPPRRRPAASPRARAHAAAGASAG